METKISFGFKKLAKKSAVIGAKPPEEKKVELIECLDAQNIKIIGHVEEEKTPLIIPMQGASKNLLDRIKEANDLKEQSRIKQKSNVPKKREPVIDLRPDSELSIEELAARKLVEEAKNYERKTTAVKVTTIAIEDQLILEGARESTMDDYESVPIGDFGMAMLRGMGWKEDQAIDKKKVDAPQLRPKGMGLGASVPGNTRNKIPLDKNGKELKLVKDAKARIIAGKEKGNYCIVQGLDDDAGRIIVKTTLAGTVLSLNEFMLFPVSDEEYAKSSKVLNNAKFEKFSKKSEENLKKIRQETRDGGKNEVEYVPNGNNVRIEVSSESEGEKERYKQQMRKDEANVKVKQERSRSLENSRSKSRRDTSRRSRSKSTSKDNKLSKSSHKSRRSRSRSRTKSRSRSNSRNKSSRRIKDLDSEISSDDDYKRKEKKSKVKKSKKHKKEKKSKKDKKEKKKSRRHSSSLSQGSSESDDERSSSRRRQ